MAVAFAVVALLYATVGQAGATGYLAAMGLFGMEPQAMRVTALALNLMVSAIGTFHVWKDGRLRLGRVLPFTVTAVPLSVLGGMVVLPLQLFSTLVGLILLLAAFQMAKGAIAKPPAETAVARPVSDWWHLVAGGVIGLVAGATGTGGGVFLAPVMLAIRCGNVREIAAATVVFNLVVSASALLGAHSSWNSFSEQMPIWLLAVGIGGGIGVQAGSRYFSGRWLRVLLAALLAVSGCKLLVT